MSLCLLGDYGSDSSPSPSSEGSGDLHSKAEPHSCEHNPLPSTTVSDEGKAGDLSSPGSRNFFDDHFEGDSTSSSSGEEEEEEEGEVAKVTAMSGSQESLPLPDLLPAMAHTGLPQTPSAGSVFSNPYKEAEEARLAVLKRHVELTPAELPESKRQRRTRFARRKKQLTAPSMATTEDCFFDEHDSSINPHQLQHKRVKAGLPEGLVPSKRYMKYHRKQQETERPWTQS